MYKRNCQEKRKASLGNLYFVGNEARKLSREELRTKTIEAKIGNKGAFCGGKGKLRVQKLAEAVEKRAGQGDGHST